MKNQPLFENKIVFNYDSLNYCSSLKLIFAKSKNLTLDGCFLSSSPVILWKKIGRPATNCNRRFFNGFRLCNVSLITYQKSQKIP